MRPRLYFPVSQEAQRLYWTPESIARLHEVADVTGRGDTAEDWGDCARDTQAVVIGWGTPRLSESVWRSLPDLRYIGIYGGSAGYMDAPVEALRAGITLTNASPEMGEGVAEATVALILTAEYGIPASAQAFRDTGELTYDPGAPNRSLAGATVGLIGFGHIGRQVAGLLSGFGSNLIVHDPYVDQDAMRAEGCESASLEDVLSRSDIVSLHAGWTPETEGMLNADRLDLLKPGALVVSTARMPIFDQHVLAERVLSGRVRFASDFIPFDRAVWSTPEMRACAHLIAVHGHTTVTDRTLRRMAERVVDDLDRFFSGKDPVNPVTEAWIARTT